MRIIAVGLRRFVSFYENRGDTLLSILSLIAIIKLGEEYFSNTYDFHTSYAMGWYLLIQCGRLFKLFFAFNDVKIFEHMRPVLIRASFIYFSIIYFFAIFGYSYFCDALDVEDAKNTTQGNDANQWPQYSHILNFKTLLQSMFTLFQISILGNWSIVMDAAVASTTKPAAAYIYFYSYRLLITLFILPILLSFIIQVFLSALAAREKEVQDEEALEEAEKQAQRASEFLDPPSASRFSLGDMGIYTSNPFLQRPSSGGIPSVSTRVSYNVNQEVLLLGRQSAGGGRNDDNDDDDDEDGDGGRGGNDDRGDGGRENTAADECDTDESETLSPLASDLHHPHSQHQRQSNYGPNSPGRQSGSLNPDKQARKQWRPHFSVKLGVDKQAATNARDKNSESIPHISSKVVTTGTSSGGVASPVAGEKGKGGGGGSAGSSVGGSGMRGSDLSSVRSGQSVDHLRSTEGSSSSSTSLSPSTHRSSSMQHAVLTSAAATPNSSRAGSADQKAKVTVQYDSKAGSSMMSIWTIGESTSAKSASSKKSGKGVSVSGKGVTSSPAEQDQVAELQAQLQAALRALDAERAKTKALAEPVNLM